MWHCWVNYKNRGINCILFPFLWHFQRHQYQKVKCHDELLVDDCLYYHKCCRRIVIICGNYSSCHLPESLRAFSWSQKKWPQNELRGTELCLRPTDRWTLNETKYLLIYSFDCQMFQLGYNSHLWISVWIRCLSDRQGDFSHRKVNCKKRAKMLELVHSVLTFFQFVDILLY